MNIGAGTCTGKKHALISEGQGSDFPVGFPYGTMMKFCLSDSASAAAGIPLNVLSAGLAVGGAVVIAHAKGISH